MAPLTIAHLFDVSDAHNASTCRTRRAAVMLTSWRDLTPSSTPRWCPSRTTPSSATGRPRPWSRLRGSIDWMCLPTFDSAACFARLLGTPDNGRWLLTVRDATDRHPPLPRRLVRAGDDLRDARRDRRRAGDHAAQRRPRRPGAPARVHPRAASRSSTSGSCGSGTAPSSRGCGTSPTTTANDAIQAIAGPDSLLLRGDRLPPAGTTTGTPTGSRCRRASRSSWR